MSDLFYIESECCVDGQCDTYAGEVSINDVMLGKFSLNSHSGKKAMVNIDIVTFDIHILLLPTNINGHKNKVLQH
ncbi:hypothetical protein [Wolbachia endosymbiont (group B) of Myelois circumvoluta]|uniref:hypothetical protein n=1 Tax=Wolbachia endosymbiont (group B) of Myelois circumvoluta TaxID=3066180 RepID=UPI00376ED203